MHSPFNSKKVITRIPFHPPFFGVWRSLCSRRSLPCTWRLRLIPGITYVQRWALCYSNSNEMSRNPHILDRDREQILRRIMWGDKMARERRCLHTFIRWRPGQTIFLIVFFLLMYEEFDVSRLLRWFALMWDKGRRGGSNSRVASWSCIRRGGDG